MVSKMNIRIARLEKIWYFVMVLAIFKPGYLPNAALLYLYYGLEAVSLLFLLSVTLKRKLANFKLLLLFGIYYFALAFSTLINMGNFLGLMEEVLTSLLVILWMHIVYQKNPKLCLELLLMVFEFLIYVNFVTILLYPNGLYRSSDAVIDARYGWFLGHQSLLSMYAAPAICISALFFQISIKRIQKIRAVLLIAACVIQILILGSANNIICISVIVILTILMHIFKIKKFPLRCAYIIIGAMTLIISVIQETSFMEPIVTKYLHRSMTFTGRTFVWERFIKLIKEQWIFGYGIQNDDVMQQSLGATHAHNQYIQCFYIGGIVLLIIFLFICFRAFKNLQFNVNTFAGKIMISAVIGLLIQMIFETYFHHTMGKVLIVLSFYFGNNQFEKHKYKNIFKKLRNLKNEEH